MSHQHVWEELVRAEEEYIAMRRALFAAGAEDQLRLALASPRGRGTALRVLIDSPIELVMDLIEPIFDAATSSHPQVGLARKIINRVDGGWLSVRLKALVTERLADAEASDADYRRVAELLSELGQPALLEVVVRQAQLSDDEDIKEVGDDFQAP